MKLKSVWTCLTSWCRPKPKDVKQLLKEIMATQAEIVAQLKTVNTQLQDANTELAKVSTESDTLLQKIKDLQAIIDAGGTIGQDLVDAVAAVATSAGAVASGIKAVDDKVPDAA